MIKVSLNNEIRELPPLTPLSEAIDIWRFKRGKIAVALNGEFVPQCAHPDTPLQEGDRIDIVAPVGGG